MKEMKEMRREEWVLEDVGEDFLGGTCHLLDIGTSLLSGSGEGLRIVDETLHDTTEVVGIANLQSSATGLETLCLLEALVVRPEDNGDIPYGRFQRVVDTHAKAASDVGDIGKAIDAG